MKALIILTITLQYFKDIHLYQPTLVTENLNKKIMFLLNIVPLHKYVFQWRKSQIVLLFLKEDEFVVFVKSKIKLLVWLFAFIFTQMNTYIK